MLAVVETSPTLLTQLVILVTTVVGFGFMWLKDTRQRNWEAIDRQVKADEVKAALDQTAKELQIKTDQQSELLVKKVEETSQEVKDEARAAYEIANHINLKIIKVVDATNRSFDQLFEEALATRKKVNDSTQEHKEIAEDTNVKVTELLDAAVPEKP